MNSTVLIEEPFYSSTYDIISVIDYYDRRKRILIEKKRIIKHIYTGNIFQTYAQFYALRDNGEQVDNIYLYSIADKMYYPITLPENNLPMKYEFEKTLTNMHSFSAESFIQTNSLKCKRCIYRNLCDRSLYD